MKFFSKKDTQKKETVKLPMSRKTKRALMAVCRRCALYDLFSPRRHLPPTIPLP